MIGKLFKLVGFSFPLYIGALHLDQPIDLFRNSGSVDLMTLEEKVGQLFMVHFRGDAANEDAKTLIQEVKVGGIIYYTWANKLHSPEQIRHLSKGLQGLAKIPLLIAADQEGGIVARCTQGFTQFPGNKALGMTKDPTLAKEAALVMGNELRSVGINMNLSPVVDVNINPQNPIIGIRSFGEFPEEVVIFGENALEGFKQANMIGTLKHFPGHGDVEVDSHLDLPIVNKSMEELEKTELLPFTKLASKADAIMTAHLFVPALDDTFCSTLSTKTLAYLRNTIGFQGVIISDSLVMEGVLKQCKSVDEAALQALIAGSDILLLGGRHLIDENNAAELRVHDIVRIHRYIVDSVKSGKISEDRIDEAVKRILKLKKLYLDLPSPTNDFPMQHPELAQKIGALALKTTQHGTIQNLDQKTILFIAPECLQSSIEKTSLFQNGKVFFFKGLNPTREEIESIKELADSADILLIYSYNAWKNLGQKKLIEALLENEKPLIAIVSRDPLDEDLFQKASLVFTTFSPTTPSFQAVNDYLLTQLDRTK